MENSERRKNFALRLKASKLLPLFERAKRIGKLNNTTIGEPKYPNNGKKSIIMDVKTYNIMVEMRKNLLSSRLRNMIFRKRFSDCRKKHIRYKSHSASKVTEADYAELTPRQFNQAKRDNLELGEKLHKRVFNNKRTLNISRRLIRRDKTINEILPKFIYNNFKKGGKIRVEHEQKEFLAHIHRVKNHNQLDSIGSGFQIIMNGINQSQSGDVKPSETYPSVESFLSS